jgi:HD-like signal output (HDOD) protein
VPGQPQPVEELQAPLKLTNVARLLREIDSLPALPDTVRHVREAMSDPRRSVDDVSGIIARDPAVAAKVLSVVNSAAYGFAHRVDSLTLAVSLLGLHETYSVVLSAAAVKVFDKSRRFDYTAFWEGSMCCAAAATLIAEASGQKHVSGVLAAGLLHDIGRLALCEIAGPTYAQLQPGLNGAELLTAEESLIGLTHAEAGFELATHWNLPDAIADAIRLHHHPQRAISSKQIVAIIVALADLLADAGSDLERGERFLEGSADLFKALKLDTAMAPVLISLFCDRQAEALRKPIL